jgi:hypothetical protein
LSNSFVKESGSLEIKENLGEREEAKEKRASSEI